MGISLVKPYIILYGISFVLIGIFTGVIITYEATVDHPNTSTIKANQTLYIKEIPISAKPINHTNVSSLVSNTESHGNTTLIHLMNGMIIDDKTNTVKTGDILYLNMTILQPVCSLSLSLAENGTLQNNTQVIIQLLKDPRCEQGFKGLQIHDWHKVTQK